jgi:hypothetical protein
VTSDFSFPSTTITSEETPVAWGESTFVDEIVEFDQGTNGFKGDLDDQTGIATVTEIVTTTADTTTTGTASWGATVEETTPVTTLNGTPPVSYKVPISTTPTPRQSRIVDPSSKFSWASIVKPPAPSPAPKQPVQHQPSPQSQQQQPQQHQQPTPQPLAPPITPQEPVPIVQASSRPSTRDQDIIEELAQTIHDPFAAAEPSKPKVQLPQPQQQQPPLQPALPYIPAIASQPKESQLPPLADPLTSRNLDLLDNQQPPAAAPVEPSASTSVQTHRASPAPKVEGPPPGLSGRFPRNRDTPVILPGIASQALSGMQLQFG